METNPPKFFDDILYHLLDFDGFVRMDFEEMFPRILPPVETYRPLPLTDVEKAEKGEVFYTYPLRLQYYREKCYAEFEKWNRTCLEGMSAIDVNHHAWVFKKFSDHSLKLMDEESGACFTAQNFFFDQDKNLVITNPR